MIENRTQGNIVGQKAVNIEISDTAKTLYDKLCTAAKQLLDEALPLIKKEQIPRQKQDLKAGSYYGGRHPEDGHIDWNKSAGEIYNLIRGVTDPYPGAFAFLDNGDKIIIWWAESVIANKGIPGELIIKDKEVLVQTGENAIKLLNIEINGKRLKGEQINDYLRNGKVRELRMKVLILGVNGFIGHHLVSRILAKKKDWIVYGMDLGTDRLGESLDNPRFNFMEGDISINREWIELQIKKCDVVMPLVAIATPKLYVEDPIAVYNLDFEMNVDIVKKMCQIS